MNWADLREELLDLILSKLFGKDRHTFSLVCKSWNAVALVSPNYHSPCLMFYQRTEGLWKIFHYNDLFSMEIPDLDDAEILCSKYGWLLVSRDRSDFFFFNPFKNEIFEVPEIDEYYITNCFFHPPTSPNCFIVGFTSVQSYFPCVSIGVLKWGEDEWNHYKYDCRTSFAMSDCAPILRRGLLYFLDIKGNIGTFNIKEPSWTIHKKCLRPARLRSKIRQHFLIKLQGEEEPLFAVFVTNDERRVNVYRLLEPDMKWESVEYLGNKTFFLSRTASFAMTTTLKSMANKIYFPMYKAFYSLDTKKYHTFDGHFSHDKIYGFKILNFATWVVPTPTF